MEKGNGRVVEIRTGSGELLFKLHISNQNGGSSENSKDEKRPDGGNGGNGKKENSGRSNTQLMSDAQKRYLFRILADQGIEGDAAYAELKKAFGVDSLKAVTKMEASREIERRLGQKGGASNGSAFN